MPWLLAISIIVLTLVAYTLIINREFLRCPHCGKVGSWRFDAIAPPVDEYDDDHLIRSSTQQKCRKCGGEVLHIWSDYEGREIRLPEGTQRLAPGNVEQREGLISVLLDRSAEFGDRHDAAMDLAGFDEPEVWEALTRVKNDPNEEQDIVEEAEQSLLEIQRRKAPR